MVVHAEAWRGVVDEGVGSDGDGDGGDHAGVGDSVGRSGESPDGMGIHFQAEDKEVEGEGDCTDVSVGGDHVLLDRASEDPAVSDYQPDLRGKVTG